MTCSDDRAGVLLALADARLPAGGHAHSGGVEQAVADGLVHDGQTLAVFLSRRLRTAGRVAAGLAAAAAAADPPAAAAAADPAADLPADPAADLPSLDAEADARTPSPAQRAASRAQGRGLVRVARAAWPDGPWAALGRAPHHPIALGVAARAGGLDPSAAALAAAYLSVAGPATAAQRLLGLDPLAVAATVLGLAGAIGGVAREAAAAASRAPADLPDDSDPLLDLLAERHAQRQDQRRDRLFAS